MRDDNLCCACPRCQGVDYAQPLTVAALQREAHETARTKGWHDEVGEPPNEAMRKIAAEGIYLAARCAFIEQHRKGLSAEVMAGVDALARLNQLDDRQIRAIAWLALVSTEVAEAVEDVREGRWESTRSESGKPGGVGSELADIVIRVGDIAGAIGVDLEREVREKLTYNRTRSYRHGGKLA